MLSMAQTAIRLILSGILLYFVYGETGVATTIAIFLLMVNSEIAALVSKWDRELHSV